MYIFFIFYFFATLQHTVGKKREISNLKFQEKVDFADFLKNFAVFVEGTKVANFSIQFSSIGRTILLQGFPRIYFWYESQYR